MVEMFRGHLIFGGCGAMIERFVSCRNNHENTKNTKIQRFEQLCLKVKFRLRDYSQLTVRIFV